MIMGAKVTENRKGGIRDGRRIRKILFAAGIFLGAFVGVAVIPAMAQQAFLSDKASTSPSYDVVSIRENKTGDQAQSMTGIGATFTARNISAATLIRNAYGKRTDLIVGMPGWVRTTRFDVTAKVTTPDVNVDKLTVEQHRKMLIDILVDRFHIVTRSESKIIPIYELVVGKTGPKLGTGGANGASLAINNKDMNDGSILVNDGLLEAKQVSMGALAQSLEQELNYTVRDKTNLDGKYDFSVKWTPDQLGASAVGVHDQDNGPSLFTALQEQLGLKLQPARGPVEVLIIDHIDLPSPN
jgi:uncharacterized protein (TIGR03435 family)